jgi:hypothetical protein
MTVKKIITNVGLGLMTTFALAGSALMYDAELNEKELQAEVCSVSVVSDSRYAVIETRTEGDFIIAKDRVLKDNGRLMSPGTVNITATGNFFHSLGLAANRIAKDIRPVPGPGSANPRLGT